MVTQQVHLCHMVVHQFSLQRLHQVSFSHSTHSKLSLIWDLRLKNPEKNIARGIAISLTLSAILYIVLQSTFITSMPSSMIHEHGWNGINFNSPFADMAILLGINWLAILLYVEAVVSPFGTGVSFVAVTGRVLRYGKEWSYS